MCIHEVDTRNPWVVSLQPELRRYARTITRAALRGVARHGPFR